MKRNCKTPNRREFLKTIGFAAAALPFVVETVAGRTMRKPKNVIFILSDDHRYDFMSFLNKPKFLETPNMDR